MKSGTPLNAGLNPKNTLQNRFRVEFDDKSHLEEVGQSIDSIKNLMGRFYPEKTVTQVQQLSA